MARRPTDAHAAWATRAGRAGLVLALVGLAIVAGAMWAIVDYCALGTFQLVFLLVGPFGAFSLLIAFVLGVTAVGRSARKWQPILTIVISLVTVLPSLLTLLPAFTIATGGTLGCPDERQEDLDAKGPRP